MIKTNPQNLDFTWKYTIPLGTIACAPYCKQKRNDVDIEIQLYNDCNGHRKPGEEYFSIMGNIWNSKGTDCVICGQCLEKIREYFGKGIDEKFKAPFEELMALYDKHNLKYTRCIPQEDLERIKELICELLDLAD